MQLQTIQAGTDQLSPRDITAEIKAMRKAYHLRVIP
jgi:hypothetical protein